MSMELKKNKLSEIIESFIPGDWGEESFSSESPNAVRCVRGADIVPIWNSDYDHIPVRYISNRSFANKQLKVGDIIIEKSGGSPTQSTGRTAFVSEELISNATHLVCTNFCTAFRIKPGWNPKYVYYYLQHLYNNDVFFNFEGKTSGLKNLQIENAFDNATITQFPIEKQNQIVEVLDNLDLKIALNRAINRNLEAFAKQLYDYWFVQFDFPDENGRPYKSSGGKMVWDEKLKRNIPQNWECVKIQEIAKTYSGGTPTSSKSEYYENGTVPWINSGELNNAYITNTSNFITELGLKESSAKLYPKNTILVALYGATAGKVSFLTFEACSNQAVCGVMLENPLMVNYTRFYLSNLLDYYILLSSGSARDNISQDTIKNTWFIKPDNEILNAFDQICQKTTQLIVANQIEIDNLTKQRDELLPLLMNGQVTIG